MSALADTGLLIAFLNRGDRHHRWAAEILIRARRSAERIVVPEVVAGEAYTKLRYDRRICGRRDARPALVLFNLLDDNPQIFEVVTNPPNCHRRGRDLLAQYVDQSFSHVDAVVLLTAEDSSEVDRVLTVDASLAAYRFSRPVVVDVPR